MSQEQMFCYQCEQTAKGQGCTIVGVCGKTPEVAALQDLLVYMLRGVSQLAIEAEKVGVKEEQVAIFTCEALFATLTNVNFDADDLVVYIRKAAELREMLLMKTKAAGSTVGFNSGPVALVLGTTREDLVGQGKACGNKI